MDKYDSYINPLCTRYATKQMQSLFSDRKKFGLWRRLWLALAQTEKEMGLDITDEQIKQMSEHLDDINFDVAAAREKEVRHDVMAHVYAFGTQCPAAMPIIHLGATSCYVGDNADLIVYYEALKLVRDKLVNVMDKLSAFAMKYKGLPTLGFTHLQPAQPVTVGKRACLWLQDVLSDFEDIEQFLENYKLRGIKGTTGTQASFLQLFDGDSQKVEQLDKAVVKKLGFKNSFAVTGQTYPRKYDYKILSLLSEVAQSAYKFGNDIRILQNRKEIEEPFEKSQIGSSAMAYKRNPMRSERICSLARLVVCMPQNAAITAATQWLERTLDDSANKRIVMAEAFLAVDAVLELMLNVCDGLVVYEKVIAKNLNAELPFMATEIILMECVKAGGDRQLLHEKIRAASMEAGKNVKQEGLDNNLIELLKKDSDFDVVKDKIDSILKAENFIGRAEQQTESFIKEQILPVLEKNSVVLGAKADINV